MPNVLGQFQLDNISTAIATIRLLNFNLKDEHIKKELQKLKVLLDFRKYIQEN